MSSYETQKLQHTPWVEKYRPKTLDLVSSQDHTVSVLKKTVSLGNLPHMLFYGPPGTGKTSTVLALAKQLYGPHLYRLRVLELNASDERGISIVRQKIKNFARLTVSNPSKDDLDHYPCPPFKIIILDEADLMTKDAQLALRRTMETYSGVTRFCLICNYITRIIDPLALRCAKFRFRALSDDLAVARLSHIAAEEGVPVDGDGVFVELLQVSGGDLRKAITYLQLATKLTLVDGTATPAISGAMVREIAGILPQPVVDALAQAIRHKEQHKITASVQELVFQGWSAQQVADQLHDVFILDDEVAGAVKNQVARRLFDLDRRLNNGGDEHIQLLNLSLQIAEAF